jgi:hypothetical protein
MPVGTRSRPVPFSGPSYSVIRTWLVDRQDGSIVGTPFVGKGVDPNITEGLTGIQITESESHPAWKHHQQGVFKGDHGGPFRTTKQYVKGVFPTVELGGSIHANDIRDFYSTYKGPMLPGAPTTDLAFPDFAISSSDELAEAGTLAIARCSPSNPAANTLTALGELVSEGLPHLVGSGLIGLRAAGADAINHALGHEYLNYQFGWKPFISDLRSIANSILNAEKMLRNFEKNSGKLVRRRYDFPPTVKYDEKTVRTGTNPYISTSADPLYVTPPVTGRLVVNTKTTKKQWFSGAFTYYIPPDDSLRNGIARYVIEARKLLGLSLTPDVVWSLVPWSWAVDWFSDVRELLLNWTNWAIDNQVLAYGYLMEHSIVESIYSYHGPTGFQTSDVLPVPLTFVSEAKVRVKATPCGFGLDWSEFSPTQLAIAAALGLTK